VFVPGDSHQKYNTYTKNNMFNFRSNSYPTRNYPFSLYRNDSIFQDSIYNTLHLYQIPYRLFADPSSPFDYHSSYSRSISSSPPYSRFNMLRWNTNGFEYGIIPGTERSSPPSSSNKLSRKRKGNKSDKFSYTLPLVSRLLLLFVLSLFLLSMRIYSSK
jgi:hypothetical protein